MEEKPTYTILYNCFMLVNKHRTHFPIHPLLKPTKTNRHTKMTFRQLVETKHGRRLLKKYLYIKISRLQ